MRNMILVVILQTLASLPLLGAEVDKANPNDPVHDELRELRENVVAAYEKGDIDALVEYVHPEAVITWQNGERNLTRQDLRDFYKKMMEGDDRVVESVTSKVAVDGLSVIHGDDTAVAYGSVDDKYKLSDGTRFDLTSRWSTTLVKEDNQWLIAGFHISANIFDNPILAAMKSYLTTIGVVAALAGLVVGAIVVKLLSKSRKSAV